MRPNSSTDEHETRFEPQGDPVFLDSEAVIDIHERELAESGGLAGFKDRNLVESAVMAPQNVRYYERGDLVDVAATYLYHIAKNHGFTDGNKRTGYIACLTFLALNGIDLGAPPCLELATLEVAASRLDKSGLAGILRQLVVLRMEDPDYYSGTHARHESPRRST